MVYIKTFGDFVLYTVFFFIVVLILAVLKILIFTSDSNVNINKSRFNSFRRRNLVIIVTTVLIFATPTLYAKSVEHKEAKIAEKSEAYYYEVIDAFNSGDLATAKNLAEKAYKNDVNNETCYKLSYIEDFIYELDSRKNGIYMDADTLVSAEMRQYVYEENLDEFIAFQLKVQQELDEKEEKRIKREQAAKQVARQAAIEKGIPSYGTLEEFLPDMFHGEYRMSAPFTYTTFRDYQGKSMIMRVTKYEYYLDNMCTGTSRLMFVVTCYNGKVIETEDWRNVNRRSGSSKSKDKYSADSYSNAEDFYYDHYDDFYDYEEAEAYYNEHN